MIFGMNLQQEQRVGKGKKYNNNNKNYHKWFVKEKFKIVINHNSLIQGFRPVQANLFKINRTLIYLHKHSIHQILTKIKS